MTEDELLNQLHSVFGAPRGTYNAALRMLLEGWLNGVESEKNITIAQLKARLARANLDEQKRRKG